MNKNLLPVVFTTLAIGALVWYFSNRTAEKPAEQPTAETGGKAAPPRVGLPTPSTPDAQPKAVAGDTDEEEETPAPFEDKVLVDLGTVEDIGRQTAAMLLARKELAALEAKAPDQRTPEENRRLLELQREQATALGMLPEITDLQNNPDEYGRFFAALLHDAANLDDTQTGEVLAFMKGRGEAMVTAGLNAANEPQDPAQEEPWEEKRDAFNETTAEGVARILPPGEAERIGFDDRFLELLEQDFDKAR